MSPFVQVFGRRQRRSDHTLRQPASEKRQGTESRREVVRRRCRRGVVPQKSSGDLVAGRDFRRFGAAVWPQPARRHPRAAGGRQRIHHGRAAAVRIPKVGAVAIVALEGSQAGCRELRDGARSPAPEASVVARDPGKEPLAAQGVSRSGRSGAVVDDKQQDEKQQHKTQVDA